MPIRQRPYQLDGVRHALAAWKRGERAVLLVSPTGSGKSLVLAKAAEAFSGRSGRVLVLAYDTTNLVTQLAEAFRRFTRMSVGVEMAGQRVNRKKLPRVVVASVQTMIRRMGRSTELLRTRFGSAAQLKSPARRSQLSGRGRRRAKLKRR